MGEAGEKDDDLVALSSLLAFGEVELFAIELGEVLSFDDLLQRLRQIGRREPEVAFGGDLLREPRMQQVVARAECDGAGTDHRDHFLHFHTREELIPKRIVQFSDHTRPEQTNSRVLATSCSM